MLGKYNLLKRERKSLKKREKKYENDSVIIKVVVGLLEEVMHG